MREKNFSAKFFVFAFSMVWLCYFALTCSRGFVFGDEGALTLLAWRLREGDVLYKTVHWGRTPLSIWIHELLLSVLGHRSHLLYIERWLWGAQFLALLTMIGLGLRGFLGNRPMIWATLLLAPLYHVGHPPMLWYDWYASFWIVASFCVVGAAPKTSAWATVAGASAALGILSKQSYVYPALALAVVVLVYRRKHLGAFVFGLLACTGAALVKIAASGENLFHFFRIIMRDSRAVAGLSLFDSFIGVHVPQMSPWSWFFTAALASWGIFYVLGKHRLAQASGALLLASLWWAKDETAFALVQAAYLVGYAGLAATAFKAWRRDDRRELALAVFCMAFQYGASFHYGYGVRSLFQGIFIPVSFLLARYGHSVRREFRWSDFAPVATLSVACYAAAAGSVFAEKQEDVFSMSGKFSEPVLKGLRVTPKRVEIIEGMLNAARRELGPGKAARGTLLALGTLQFAAFALDVLPPGPVTWFFSWEMNLESFEAEFAAIQRVPPRVILSDKSWESFVEWGIQGEVPRERYRAMDQWLQANYVVADRFANYRVWRKKAP